jgi:small subunit ribosomal protein S10
MTTVKTKKNRNRIRIYLRSFDYRTLDECTAQIVDTATSSGVHVVGPVPIPTKRKIFTVNRSVHVDKKSRDQFELKIHQRIIDIWEPSGHTVDNLKKLNVPAGVDIEIDVQF